MNCTSRHMAEVQVAVAARQYARRGLAHPEKRLDHRGHAAGGALRLSGLLRGGVRAAENPHSQVQRAVTTTTQFAAGRFLGLLVPAFH